MIEPMDDEEKIDGLILSACSKNFLKVARIIGDVCTTLGEIPYDDNGPIIEKRIRALIEQGKLEGAGDLSRWRESEIRLLVE